MHVASYAASDALELVRLWRESFEHGVGITDPNPIEDQLDFFLREVVPRNTVRVAREEGAIVAFLASRPASITCLYVKVSCLGRGIGTGLLDIAKADSSGSLWLYTFARNKNARRFYERHGFEEGERESQNMFKLEAIQYRWRRSSGEA